MTDILSDKTNKVLRKMSIPIGVGMLSTFLFQVVDTYFIGKLGSESLAALGFSSTIYFVLVSLYIGLSIGVSIIIGQAVGQGDMPKVKKTTWLSLLLSFGLSVILSTISILFIDPIFSALGASNEILPLIKEYTIPILIGMPFLTIGITASGILRASGNITKPEVIMAIAGLINVILDYALIFGKWGLPEMGIQGAAYATAISWFFVLIGMIVLLLQDKLLGAAKDATNTIKSLTREIFKLGLPTILTQIIGPLTVAFLTFLLAQQSPMAVAAFGVVSRIEMLLLIGVLSVSTAITPFVAQNSGAKSIARIDQAIVFGGKASTYISLIIATLLFIFVKPIVSIFSEDPDIINYATNYFYIICLSYAFYALYLITTAVFNGLQKTLISLKITLMKSLIFAVPLTLIGSNWGVNGIFIGLALANVLAGIYAAIIMRKEIKENHPDLKKLSAIQDYKNDFRKLFKK
ncbi:MAG: putative MATE family efflux protein [Crocinitomix sp.]|jgi:putative MATE family efflux protein